MAESAWKERVFNPEVLQSLPAEGSGPGLDPTDPRLDQISAAVFKNSYDQVVLQAQEIWSSGAPDARLLGYYLFGAFVDRGLSGLPLLFKTATAALTEKWASFVPAERKAALADSNLAWLFDHILKRIEFHHRTQDAQWRTWWATPDIDLALMDAQKLAPALEAALEQATPRGKSRMRFGRLRRWVEEVASTAKTSSPRPKSEPDERPDPEGDGDSAEQEADAPDESREAEASPSEGGLASESPAMALLLEKLAAFQVLVKRGQYQKAAIVAQDLDALMTNFDPRVYLPRLFSPYFATLHENLSEIEPRMEDTESFAAKTLAQLYRVDLGAFLREG